MKKIIIISTLFLCLFHVEGIAQEKFGNTLNIGLGIGGYGGYYRYVGGSLPVINANYEFDVASSFTLAPFISVSSYSREYYWGDKKNPDRYYRYRETIIPIGVKGTYYFDRVLNANSKWDFYGSGSLGLALINSRWESGYGGDKNQYRRGNPLFLDLHLGVEYHVTDLIGIFLDASTGISTIGLAIHQVSTD